MSGFSGWIRKICLIALIVFDIASMIFWWMADNLFFWVFLGINLSVIGGEIWSVIKSGNTLSTNTTKMLEKDDARMRYVMCALLCFSLAMVFLVFHLIVQWK